MTTNTNTARNSAKALKSIKSTKPAAKPAAKIVRQPRSHKHHPAELAGMKIHQAVENTVLDVADTVVGAAATTGKYVFNFVKGLVKGH